MEDFNSKYTGEQVENLLDQVASGEIGGGGITEETDPIFSASPAASITEEKKAEWDNKVDKVNGKQLSTEDFTTALKGKLEGLSNYDDTELSEALSTLRGDFDKLVSGDTTTAIKTFNEIIAFLDGIQDTQDLSSIIASIEQQIAAKQDKITDLETIREGAAKGATALQSVPSEYVTEDELLWVKVEGEAGVRLKGTNGTATGNLAISAGDDKKASDGTQFVSAASGDHSVAFGYGNTCAGRSTLAQGLYNTVNGKDSVAFGQRNLVGGDQAFAAGQQNEVTARLGVAIGYKNKATNTDSIAIGYQNTSSGSASVAMGDTCEASGTSSTAMGYKTKATGAYSSTFGQNTQATNEGEVAMGLYNKSTTSTDAAEQTMFSFGIGTSDTNRANAFEIKKNGDVYVGDKLLSDAITLADTAVQPEDVAGIVTEEGFVTADDLAGVASSGDYNDLNNKPIIPAEQVNADWNATSGKAQILNKPTIPAAVTESTVSGWGFTKNTGTYSKPSGGIPETDLSEEVRSALVAAQAYKGTVNNITINGSTKSQNNGVIDLGNIVTSVKVNNATKSPSGGVVDLGSVGTYSKPSTGIPKSDLASDVQASLGKADTAVQPKDIKDEVYIADFTMESLRVGIYNGTYVDCDMQRLVDAMNANKVILVREGEDSLYKGVYVLNGFAEDLLYFSIVDTSGNILWCEGTDWMSSQYIDGQSLHIQNWHDKQDTLVSGENIKTINGESILGSGNIVISGGGGSSSGGGAYSEVNHGTSDTTFTLTPNTFHIWDEVGSLALDLGGETSGVANEYLFQFTSGSEPTTLSLPDDIKWTGGDAPTIEANKIYQVSILKGLGSVLEWDNATIGTFTINYGQSSTVNFNFDKGMTWQDFVDSEYNTDSVITIYNSRVVYSNYFLIDNVSPTDAIINNNIYSSTYWD